MQGVTGGDRPYAKGLPYPLGEGVSDAWWKNQTEGALAYDSGGDVPDLEFTPPGGGGCGERSLRKPEAATR